MSEIKVSCTPATCVISEDGSLVLPYYEIYVEELQGCFSGLVAHRTTVAIVTEEGIAIDFCERHSGCKYSTYYYKKSAVTLN